jgi:hypothetical protein
MRFVQSALLAIALFLAITPIHGDEPIAADAARYIRALFDATPQENGNWPHPCGEIEALGRFAAGRLWQTLSDPERARSDEDFCALAVDAVDRLRRAFPGMKLAVTSGHSAAQGMVVDTGAIATMVRGLADRGANAAPSFGGFTGAWCITWYIAAQSRCPAMAGKGAQNLDLHADSGAVAPSVGPGIAGPCWSAVQVTPALPSDM